MNVNISFMNEYECQFYKWMWIWAKWMNVNVGFMNECEYEFYEWMWM